MLEILYRVYRTLSDEERTEQQKECENDDFGLGYSYSFARNEEITMDCYLCETRDEFKAHIRDVYGPDTKFANSKKFPPNTYYCIIIGEHCWNTEKYFNVYEYECDFCHKKVKSFVDNAVTLSPYEIREKLGNQTNKYLNKKFCCGRCMYRYIDIEQSKMQSEDIHLNAFVCRDDFTNHNLAGYIYKITKKSTGEFYVGQTIYAPVFRWGQHLKTDRFKIKDILDYKFETIELVPKSENLLEREKYWIQKLYKENPSLSLNIAQTHNLEKELPDEQEID